MFSASIFGRLVKDPELSYTKNKTPVANFSVAVNTFDKTDFVKVSVFGGQSTPCVEYLHKGSKVCCSGRYHAELYESKEGKIYLDATLNADYVAFVNDKQDEERNAQREEPTPSYRKNYR